jgi:hypothetical protein
MQKFSASTKYKLQVEACKEKVSRSNPRISTIGLVAVFLIALFAIGMISQLNSPTSNAATEQNLSHYSWSLVNVSSNTTIARGTRDWQYGPQMTPSYSTYQAIEMPTAGLHWTTAPSGAGWSYWVASTTQYNNFAQNGFFYNGQSYTVCIESGSTCVPPHSWAMFWTFTDEVGNYYGNGILPPSGWNPGDHIYFSVAVYPATKIDGDFAFWFTDSTNGQRYIINGCNALIGGYFTGNVGGLSESSQTSGFGNIYVDQATLWAESSFTSQRVSGATSAYNSGAPSTALINIEGGQTGSFGIFQTGFNSGQNYLNGHSLTPGSSTLGLEDFPTRGSCS